MSGINQELLKYTEKAKLVFSQTKYCQGNYASDKEILAKEIRKLAQNMILLEEKNLSIVNKKLMESGRKVWDFLTEHLFAAELIAYNPDAQIEYEPDYMKKPIDFVINQDDISYWLQIKRLSVLERKNRQDKIFRTIKEQLKNIDIPLFILTFISEKFREQDIKGLLNEIEHNACRNNAGKTFKWLKSGEERAAYKFILPNKAVLCNLTPGMWGDMNQIVITGENATQIKGSLEKASIAINRNSYKTNINLIVMEADDKENIDISDACFGTEIFMVSSGTQFYRDSNGYFNNGDYSQRITGVIALRREENKPISSYKKALFVNPRFVDSIENIKKIIDIDQIIYESDSV